MIMMRLKLMFETNYIEINLLSTVSLYYFQVFKYLVIGTKLCLELLHLNTISMNDLQANRWKTGRQFGRSEKRLLDAIVRVETIPIATIKRRFEELKSNWIICQRAHQTYIESLNDIYIQHEEK